MIQLILAVLLIGISIVFYKVWLKPVRTMKFYSKKLKSLGYKVLQKQYNPLYYDLAINIHKGILQGDAMKVYKQDHSGYDVVVSNVLLSPKLEIRNTDFLKDFYAVDKHYQYPKWRNVVQALSYLIGYGLPFSEGTRWKRKRIVFNKIFNFDFVKSQCDTISRICQQSINRIQKDKVYKNQRQEYFVQFNIVDLTVDMFSNVVMQIFLGGKQEKQIQNQSVGVFIRKLIGDINLEGLKTLAMLLGKKYSYYGLTSSQRDINRRVQMFKNWGLSFIQKRISQINKQLQKDQGQKQPKDIIEALIMSNKKYEDSKEVLCINSKQQILEEFASFYIAGTDTTANYTQMMIYLIAKHPQIERKIRGQIQKYMGSDDYSYQNLKNLVYIDQVQKQTTRYYGPITQLFERNASVDNYLNGLPVRKGTSIAILSMGIHHDERYFKNPKQFRPERWDQECNNLPPYALGGFGAGARTCIGKHLAMLQNKIALIKFMKRYKQIILPKQDFKMVFKFLYCPEDFNTKLIINQENS